MKPKRLFLDYVSYIEREREREREREGGRESNRFGGGKEGRGVGGDGICIKSDVFLLKCT